MTWLPAIDVTDQVVFVLCTCNSNNISIVENQVFLSDCSSKANAIVSPIKLCIVSSYEVCSQYPDGTSRGRHIQCFERHSADILPEL